MDTQIPQPNIPEEPKKPWLSSHMIVGYVFLFAVLAAAVSGIYYWQIVRQIPTSFQSPVHKDVTANWKTYTNSQYGFEFKYPAGWYDVTNDYDIKYGTLIHLRSTFLEIQSGGVAPEGIEGKDFVREGYEIIAGTQEKNNLVVDITKSIPDEQISTKLNIPNVVAHRLDDIGGLTSGPTVYIENPKDTEKYITISNDSVITKYSDAEEVFSQILSTFKFTQ